MNWLSFKARTLVGERGVPGNRGNKWPSLSPGNTWHIIVTFLSQTQERTPFLCPYKWAALNFTHHCSRFHSGEIIHEQFRSDAFNVCASIKDPDQHIWLGWLKKLGQTSLQSSATVGRLFSDEITKRQAGTPTLSGNLVGRLSYCRRTRSSCQIPGSISVLFVLRWIATLSVAKWPMSSHAIVMQCERGLNEFLWWLVTES